MLQIPKYLAKNTWLTVTIRHVFCSGPDTTSGFKILKLQVQPKKARIVPKLRKGKIIKQRIVKRVHRRVWKRKNERIVDKGEAAQ